MATSILVAGPTSISVTVAGTTSVLGYSDNDNLPSIQFTDHQHEVKTVLRGNVPEEIVMQGTSARISLALVKWDEAVLTSLLAEQRGSATVPVVGRRLVANADTFVVTIASTIVGSTMAYSFGACYLLPDSVGDSQWGNRERVLTLNIAAIPTTAGTLYTYTP